MNARFKVTAVVAVVALLISMLAASAVGTNAGARIETLWGSAITVRQFFLAVSPELLGWIPREAWDTLIQWDVDSTHAGWIGTDDTDSAERGARARDITDIWVSHENIFDVWGRTIDFGASSTVIWPPFTRMDMMSVFGFLMEGGNIIATTGETDYDVWRLLSSTSTRVDGGARYRNMSYHYVDYPVGYYPPSVVVVRYSWEVWIDE